MGAAAGGVGFAGAGETGVGATGFTEAGAGETGAAGGAEIVGAAVLATTGFESETGAAVPVFKTVEAGVAAGFAAAAGVLGATDATLALAFGSDADGFFTTLDAATGAFAALGAAAFLGAESAFSATAFLGVAGFAALVVLIFLSVTNDYSG